jgi:hypothetical protein
MDSGDAAVGLHKLNGLNGCMILLSSGALRRTGGGGGHQKSQGSEDENENENGEEAEAEAEVGGR